MTIDPQHALIEALDSLLEQEREALVDGRLSALPEILERKEQLIDSLNEMTGLASVDLQPLRGKVMRNQALLDGALKGIRSVANRFSTLRRMRRTLETYDDQGRKSSLVRARDNTLEKRA
ncbi:flagellar protein FlgN [Pseudooceanicola sp. CBS1P-1]|uniref:Flagellar protein FlgN n=1 Tax=Pseudooceanicola albus TaxID=2692189 RepID=A0A6L7G969_9RHOB|nr:MULTISPECIES: flagellar export chaperone FlgN [Pseudooceanicola]MBT9385847.1 flagellar protein FlgN [Pseudooceanicola endophyticus]MXN20078.1 flagellar protein FlgN [Pseudooceanicola albus]